LAVEFNRAISAEDEWFDEPDDLDRVQRALSAVDSFEDPVDAAAVLAYRVARSQGFTEGNKRTALLLARWVLDRNGIDGALLIPRTTIRLATCSSRLRQVSTSKPTSWTSWAVESTRRRDPNNQAICVGPGGGRRAWGDRGASLSNALGDSGWSIGWPRLPGGYGSRHYGAVVIEFDEARDLAQRKLDALSTDRLPLVVTGTRSSQRPGSSSTTLDGITRRATTPTSLQATLRSSSIDRAAKRN
jgi:hypothetical protein